MVATVVTAMKPEDKLDVYQNIVEWNRILTRLEGFALVNDSPTPIARHLSHRLPTKSEIQHLVNEIIGSKLAERSSYDSDWEPLEYTRQLQTLQNDIVNFAVHIGRY